MHPHRLGHYPTMAFNARLSKGLVVSWGRGEGFQDDPSKTSRVGQVANSSKTGAQQNGVHHSFHSQILPAKGQDGSAEIWGSSPYGPTSWQTDSNHTVVLISWLGSMATTLAIGTPAWDHTLVPAAQLVCRCFFLGIRRGAGCSFHRDEGRIPDEPNSLAVKTCHRPSLKYRLINPSQILGRKCLKPSTSATRTSWICACSKWQLTWTQQNLVWHFESSWNGLYLVLQIGKMKATCANVEWPIPDLEQFALPQNPHVRGWT